MPMRLGAAALVVVAEQQTALHLAADAAQRRGGQHALGRAARADIHVDPGFRVGGGDDSADVAVGDQHDARAGGAHLGDQFGMARTVEDADDEIGDLGLLRLGEIFQVNRRLLVDIDKIVGQSAADRDFVHINIWRVEKIRRHRPSRRPPARWRRPWR